MRKRMGEAERIELLKKVVRQRERQVQRLAHEQRSLLHRCTAAHATLLHCDALLQLGHLLHGNPDKPPPWQAHLEYLKQRLDAESSAHGGPLAQQIEECNHHRPPHLGLHWSPVAAASSVGEADLSAVGLQAKARLLLQHSGPLLR